MFHPTGISAERYQKAKIAGLFAADDEPCVVLLCPRAEQIDRPRTVIQLHGTGPWEIMYVNPQDDPRKQK